MIWGALRGGYAKNNFKKLNKFFKVGCDNCSVCNQAIEWTHMKKKNKKNGQNRDDL